MSELIADEGATPPLCAHANITIAAVVAEPTPDATEAMWTAFASCGDCKLGGPLLFVATQPDPRPSTHSALIELSLRAWLKMHPSARDAMLHEAADILANTQRAPQVDEAGGPTRDGAGN